MTDQIAWDTFGPIIIPLKLFYFHEELIFNRAVHFSSSQYSPAHSLLYSVQSAFIHCLKRKKEKKESNSRPHLVVAAQAKVLYLRLLQVADLEDLLDFHGPHSYIQPTLLYPGIHLALQFILFCNLHFHALVQTSVYNTCSCRKHFLYPFPSATLL